MNRRRRSAASIGRPVSPEPEPEPESTVQRLVPRSVRLPEPSEREPIAVRPGGEFWILDEGASDGLARAIGARLEAHGFQVRLIDRAEIDDLAAPTRLDGLVLGVSGTGDGDAALEASFRLLQTAAPGLRQAGKEQAAVLATLARIDGRFGLGTAEAWDAGASVLSGGLAGLAKTAAHEWPEVACKAIDIDPGFACTDGQNAARAVVDEVLSHGPVEVGLDRAGRSTVSMAAEPVERADRTNTLDSPIKLGDVVVISGGARGITAEVAVGLARVYRPTIVILGRSPEPKAEPDWLASIDETDTAGLKRALAAHAGRSGNGSATPQKIAEQARQITAGREIARNLKRIEAAGARAVYQSVDVRDGAAVQALSG